MTDSLERELPQMLLEHRQIGAAIGTLREAAKADQAPDVERLADALALHARTEEEVLYPAAILVGQIIRTRYPDPSLQAPYRKAVSSRA